MKLALCLFAAAGLGLGFAAPLQKRVSKEPPKFADVHAQLAEHWNKKAYGSCTESLQQLQRIVSKARRQEILNALPKPAGWTIKEDDSMDQADANPMAAAMLGSVGTIVKRDYRAEEGKGRMSVTVTADSPMVQMFSMMIGNPAMLPKGAELIEYEAHRAVLEPKGSDGLKLTILIAEKHICEVDARGATEDQLFGAFDQKAVDGLATALTN